MGIITYGVEASPDFPELEAKDWQRIRDVVIVNVQSLMTQRNYQRQCPVIMGLIGQPNETTAIVAKLKFELDQLFAHRLEPETYGEILEFLYVKLNCLDHDGESGRQLAIGLFSEKKRSFACVLYFPKAFATWENNLQRKYFRDNLMTVIDALEQKVKKNLKYNCAKLRRDVAAVLDEWSLPTTAH